MNGFCKRFVWLAPLTAAGLVLALTGCPKEDDDGGDAATTGAASPETTSAPTAPATTTILPEGMNPEIVPRVRAELDNRDPERTDGTALSVDGTKVSFQAPDTWKVDKSGDFQIAVAEGGATKLAAIHLGEDSAESKLSAATGALGYADCSWNPPESLAVGKDRLAATGYDGICKSGDKTVRAAYVTLLGDGMNVLAVGGWTDPGGKDAELFSTLRTAARAGGGGGGGAIATCCSAIAGNMANAPDVQKPYYKAALGVCNMVRTSPDVAQALAQIRAALGSNVVPGC